MGKDSLEKKVLELVVDNKTPKTQIGKMSENMIGESEIFRGIIMNLFNYARSESRVLILGETGVGKELAARYLWANSDRANEKFVVVDCASGPESLLEAKLFGTKKGSYTGAENTIGSFEEADGGTIFLDEIGELSWGSQKNLLRVLQEGEISKIGENTPRKVDVRIIAATNKNLFKEVKKGTFREDLYYRLNVLTIELPPLKKRGKGDIILLAYHFLEKKRADNERYKNVFLSEEALNVLTGYDWPGNIRELEYCIVRAAINAEGGEIKASHLKFDYDVEKKHSQSSIFNYYINPRSTLKDSLDGLKKYQIAMTLGLYNGNRTKSAESLDIQRTYLSRCMAQYNLAGENWKNLSPINFLSQSTQDEDSLCEELEKVRKELHEATLNLKVRDIELEKIKSEKATLSDEFGRKIIELDVEIREITGEITKLQIEMEKKNKLIEEKDAAISEMKKQMENYPNETQETRQELQKITQKLEATEKELEEVKSENTTLNDECLNVIFKVYHKIKEFDGEISRLQAELREKNKLLRKGGSSIIEMKDVLKNGLINELQNVHRELDDANQKFNNLQSEMIEMENRGKKRSQDFLKTLGELEKYKGIAEKYAVILDIFQKTLDEAKQEGKIPVEIKTEVMTGEQLEIKPEMQVIRMDMNEVEIKIEENLDVGQCQKDVKVAKKKGGWPKGKKRKIEPKINPSGHEEKEADPVSESDKGTEAQAEPKKRGRKFGSKDKVKRKSRSASKTID